MKNRNGVVLFVTLMMMMLLMGIVGVFLTKTKESKDITTKEYAIVQTNIMMKNVADSLYEVKLDQQTIFFASQVPLPINFGLSNAVINIDSAQKYISIGALISATLNEKDKKRDEIANTFISFLMKHKLKEPSFFLHILQDSIDDDSESRSGLDSEIVEFFPTFRQGNIFNKQHFDQIIDYYFDKSGDAQIYQVPFYDVFSFKNNRVDLNYASLEVLELLFDDMNGYVLQAINSHQDLYTDDDLENEFGDINAKKLLEGTMGHTTGVKTTRIKISVSLKYKSQFESIVSFECALDSKDKIKSIENYTIDEIILL
jgi:hypothetical protein